MERGESWGAWNGMQGSTLRKMLSMAGGRWSWWARLSELWISSLPLTPVTTSGTSLSPTDPGFPHI